MPTTPASCWSAIGRRRGSWSSASHRCNWAILSPDPLRATAAHPAGARGFGTETLEPWPGSGVAALVRERYSGPRGRGGVTGETSFRVDDCATWPSTSPARCARATAVVIGRLTSAERVTSPDCDQGWALLKRHT